MLQIRSLSWDTLAKAKSLSFTVNDVSKRLKVNRNAQDYVLRLDLQNFGKFQFVWTKLKTSLVHYFPFPYPPIYGKSMFSVWNVRILFTNDEFDCWAAKIFLTLVLVAHILFKICAELWYHYTERAYVLQIPAVLECGNTIFLNDRYLPIFLWSVFNFVAEGLYIITNFKW